MLGEIRPDDFMLQLSLRVSSSILYTEDALRKKSCAGLLHERNSVHFLCPSGSVVTMLNATDLPSGTIPGDTRGSSVTVCVRDLSGREVDSLGRAIKTVEYPDRCAVVTANYLSNMRVSAL